MAPVISTERYYDALVRLGSRVSEAQRRMLAANANAPRMTLDVVALARAAGQRVPQFTYSQYGRLGHELAEELRHHRKEYVWTRLVGSDSRNPRSGLVQWRIHRELADAVQRIGWTSGFVAPTADGEITEAAASLTGLDRTSREALVQARLKQGLFRQRLVESWGSCSVTGCTVLEALTASHIKPWHACTNAERLDVHNGLLLIGTLDRLFDAGLITFTNDGLLLASKRLSQVEKRLLGIRPGLRLRRIDKERLPFLRFHRMSVFDREVAE